MSSRQETIMEILRTHGPMTAQDIGRMMEERGMTGPTSSRDKVGHTLRVLSRYGMVKQVGEERWRNGAIILVWEAVQ